VCSECLHVWDIVYMCICLSVCVYLCLSVRVCVMHPLLCLFLFAPCICLFTWLYIIVLRACRCVVWSEDEAQIAWDDIMAAEPCIYLSADGVICVCIDTELFVWNSAFLRGWSLAHVCDVILITLFIVCKTRGFNVFQNLCVQLGSAAVGTCSIYTMLWSMHTRAQAYFVYNIYPIACAYIQYFPRSLAVIALFVLWHLYTCIYMYTYMYINNFICIIYVIYRYDVTVCHRPPGLDVTVTYNNNESYCALADSTLSILHTPRWKRMNARRPSSVRHCIRIVGLHIPTVSARRVLVTDSRQWHTAGRRAEQVPRCPRAPVPARHRDTPTLSIPRAK